MSTFKVEQFKRYSKGRWQTLFVQNWWVAVFLLSAYLLFAHALGKKEVNITQLEAQMSMVQEDIAIAHETREELLLQIASQRDPRWIEMVLMRRLGLVPEGQVKVVFEKR